MLEHHATLRDGEKVLIRPLKPEDAALYPDFLGEVTADDLRRAQLFDVTVGTCQTFLTCTHTRSLPAAVLANARVYRVSTGMLAEGGD